MNKAEELKQNLDVLYEGERMPWRDREILNQLQLYADEQSREEAVKYGKWYANNRPLTIEVDHNYYNVYDEWKSKEGER